MRAHVLVPLALAFALGGCSGGGSSGAPVAPVAGPVVPSTATFPLSFVIPSKTVAVTSSVRAPRYASPGTASVAVYDGATLIYVANYTQATGFTTVLFGITKLRGNVAVDGTTGPATGATGAPAPPPPLQPPSANASASGTRT